MRRRARARLEIRISAVKGKWATQYMGANLVALSGVGIGWLSLPLRVTGSHGQMGDEIHRANLVGQIFLLTTLGVGIG